MPILATFIGLLGGTIADATSRRQLQTKSRQDWILDLTGLWVQGILVPFLQVSLMLPLWQFLLPAQQHCWQLPLLPTLLLSFVIVDYAYYWNHRWLHRALWSVHQVHHTVTQMDVLGTSRNTLWTSLLIVYLWIHPLCLYLLAHPIGYLLGVSLTAALDLWRHSQWTIAPNTWLYRCLAGWLILPQDHAWHHSPDVAECNYGANLKLWDRLHGTYYACDRSPPAIGLSIPLTLTQKLLFPCR
ncbi:MAG: sterol desaturase family protein [Pantanalinema sp. GBBB05]|nr:sterol desaturase family protein [Pantanalinema sp. GBBB05]